MDTPFDTLIAKNFPPKTDDAANVFGFLRIFRILYIDGLNIQFGPAYVPKDYMAFSDQHTRMKLLFFQIISQLNICGGRLKTGMPKFQEINDFRNMCIEHYDDYINLPGQTAIGFLISRKANGVFPSGEWAAGKNQPTQYPAIKAELEAAIKELSWGVARFHHSVPLDFT